MSYILQALKRAEAERRLGSVPDAQAVLAPEPGAALTAADDGVRRRLPALALLVALVLLGAALAVWFWRSGAAPQPVPAAAAVAAPAASPAAVPPAVAPSVAPAPVAAAPASAAPDVVVAPAAPAAPVVELVEPKAVAAPTAPAVVPTPAAAAPPQPDLPWLEQLAPAQRAGLPKLAVDGAIHSSQPSERMLLLDGQVYREGDAVAPGLVLERIERSAAVLRWRDQRFRLRL